MRKSRFSDRSLPYCGKRTEPRSPKQPRRCRVSEHTVYAWRKHVKGLEPNDLKRLKALEGENVKLSRLLAERDLEIDLMRQVNRKKW